MINDSHVHIERGEVLKDTYQVDCSAEQILDQMTEAGVGMNCVMPVSYADYEAALEDVPDAVRAHPGELLDHARVNRWRQRMGTTALRVLCLALTLFLTATCRQAPGQVPGCPDAVAEGRVFSPPTLAEAETWQAQPNWVSSPSPSAHIDKTPQGVRFMTPEAGRAMRKLSEENHATMPRTPGNSATTSCWSSKAGLAVRSWSAVRAVLSTAGWRGSFSGISAFSRALRSRS